MRLPIRLLRPMAVALFALLFAAGAAFAATGRVPVMSDLADQVVSNDQSGVEQTDGPNDQSGAEQTDGPNDQSGVEQTDGPNDQSGADETAGPNDQSGVDQPDASEAPDVSGPGD